MRRPHTVVRDLLTMRNFLLTAWLLAGCAATAQTTATDTTGLAVYYPDGAVSWQTLTASDSTMSGFQGRFGQYRAVFMPFVGRPELPPAPATVARPDTTGDAGSRAFWLPASRIRAELTATDRVLLQRFVFPPNKEQGHLLLNLGQPDSLVASCYRVSASEWTGHLAGVSDTAFFILRFSWACHNARLLDMTADPYRTEVRANSQNLVGLFDFFPQAEPLVVAMTFSTQSLAAARGHMPLPYANPQFDAAKTATRKAWAAYRPRPQLVVDPPLPAVPMPILAQGEVWFKKSTVVALSCADPEAVIFYTLNGAAPSAQTMRYSGPFTLKKNTQLRTVALRNGQVSPLLSIDFVRARR